MTIHYPTGSRSETSSFRFQMEPPHQIRPSFAAGCCIFWRAQTQKFCIHATAQDRLYTLYSQIQGPYSHLSSARLYLEKFPKQDRFCFFKVLVWLASDFRLGFRISTWLISNHQMFFYRKEMERGKRHKLFPDRTAWLIFIQMPPCYICTSRDIHLPLY